MCVQEPEIIIFDGLTHDMLSTPDLNGKAEAGFSGRTSNYRGYVGVWEIKSGKLYLNEVRGGRMNEPGPIFADWVSAKLKVCKGNILENTGYSALYEEYIFFDIQNGILKNVLIENNIEKFKTKSFSEVRAASDKNRIRYL